MGWGLEEEKLGCKKSHIFTIFRKNLGPQPYSTIDKMFARYQHDGLKLTGFEAE